MNQKPGMFQTRLRLYPVLALAVLLVVWALMSGCKTAPLVEDYLDYRLEQRKSRGGDISWIHNPDGTVETYHRLGPNMYRRF